MDKDTAINKVKDYLSTTHIVSRNTNQTDKAFEPVVFDVMINKVLFKFSPIDEKQATISISEYSGYTKHAISIEEYNTLKELFINGTIPVDKQPPTTETLWKIREMYWSANAEDQDIAYKWLCQLIGEKDADANLFILAFHKDWDDDSDYIIDDNYWKMKFETYAIRFGKDYRYRITMSAKFHGAEIMNEQKEYSRYAVGNGQPKFDFCHQLCEVFRKLGYSFYDGLFYRFVIKFAE